MRVMRGRPVHRCARAPQHFVHPEQGRHVAYWGNPWRLGVVRQPSARRIERGTGAAPCPRGARLDRHPRRGV